jgi:hypothetical protein
LIEGFVQDAEEARKSEDEARLPCVFVTFSHLMPLFKKQGDVKMKDRHSTGCRLARSGCRYDQKGVMVLGDGMSDHGNE